MWFLRRHPVDGIVRSGPARLDRLSTLPATVDATRGSSNLATIPRSGNISTDARAGRFGRVEA
jgi:hypothetical protein